MIKAKKQDCLNRRLSNRSSVDELKRRSIIKDEETLKQQKLRRQSAELILTNEFQKRAEVKIRA